MSADYRVPRCLVAVGLLAVLVGCGDTSPVTPGREPLTYEGEIASEGFNSHELLLERGGTVRVQLVELSPIFLDISDLPPNATLEEALGVGVGIGEFNEEGTCVLELRPTLVVGRIVTVLLSDNINCLAVFDSGQLPPDSLLRYRVVVTDAAG